MQFVAQFDPSLGTLTTVLVFEAASFNGGATYSNSSGAIGFFNAFGFPNFFLTASTGDSYNIVSSSEVAFDDIVSPGGSTTDTFTAQGFGSFQPDSAPYIGLGLLTFDVSANANLFEFHDPNLSLVSIGLTSTSYMVDVSYEFTPAAPEPSSMIATAAMAAFFLFWRSFRKRGEGTECQAVPIDPLQ